MMQTLSKNWWLLALYGILHAIISAVYFDHAGRGFALKGTMMLLGKMTVAAGACAIAAGVWRSRTGKSWLLVLNGFALSALGLTFNGIFGFRISLRTVALLMILTAISFGIFQLVIARTLGSLGHATDEWFFGIAGAASIVCALPFSVLAFRWIRLGPGTHVDLLLFGVYFCLTAICMLALALRLQSLGRSQSNQWQDLTPLGNPRHAH